MATNRPRLCYRFLLLPSLCSNRTNMIPASQSVPVSRQGRLGAACVQDPAAQTYWHVALWPATFGCSGERNILVLSSLLEHILVYVFVTHEMTDVPGRGCTSGHSPCYRFFLQFLPWSSDYSCVPTSICCLLDFQEYVTCLIFPKAVLDLFWNIPWLSLYKKFVLPLLDISAQLNFTFPSPS